MAERRIRTTSGRWQGLLAGLIAATCLCSADVAAQYGGRPAPSPGPALSDQAAPELQGADITDLTGSYADIDTVFVNERGERVVLRDLIREGRPVFLTLNYFRCPMLCIATLNGMIEGLNDVEWSAGNEFDIITLSFAHDEGPDLAAAKKESYLSAYRRDGGEQGWHFLTGEEDQIRRLADSVGFGFRKDERTGEYAHSSTIIFLTPEGRISKYMNDVLFQPRDLRFALVEASQGRLGSPLDKFLLFTCFMYDPQGSTYAMSAFRLMRFAGLLTLVTLILWLGFLFLRGSARKGEVRSNVVLDGGTHS